MYDMYPWNAAADGPRARAPKPRAGEAMEATAAVQVALDRRDGGGEAADDEAAGTTATAGLGRK